MGLTESPTTSASSKPTAPEKRHGLLSWLSKLATATETPCSQSRFLNFDQNMNKDASQSL